LNVQTSVIIGATVALFGAGVLLKRKPRAFIATLSVASVLALLVVVPLAYQGAALVAASALIGLSIGTNLGSRILFGALGAIIILIPVAVFPGGVSASVLAMIAFAGFGHSRDAAHHLIRLSRAAQLVPGRAPSHEVEIAGTVFGPEGKVPGLELHAACWRLVRGPRFEDGAELPSSGLLAIQGRQGIAYVDLEGAEVEAMAHPLTSEELASLYAALGTPLAEGRGGPGEILLFAAGKDVYAVGIPAWEASPDAGAGYRDSASVPVFRRRSGMHLDVFVACRAEVAIRRDSWWTLSTWLVWGAVCALIAAGLAVQN